MYFNKESLLQDCITILEKVSDLENCDCDQDVAQVLQGACALYITKRAEECGCPAGAEDHYLAFAEKLGDAVFTIAGKELFSPIKFQGDILVDNLPAICGVILDDPDTSDEEKERVAALRDVIKEIDNTENSAIDAFFSEDKEVLSFVRKHEAVQKSTDEQVIAGREAWKRMSEMVATAARQRSGMMEFLAPEKIKELIHQAGERVGLSAEEVSDILDKVGIPTIH